MLDFNNFSWGNESPMQGSGSFTPTNSATSLYNQIMGLQTNNFSQYSVSKNPQLKVGAALGDMFSQSLISNSKTNDAIRNIQGLVPPKGAASSNVKTGGAFSKANIGGTASIAGGVADLASSFLPQKKEYASDKGHITQGLDTAYDAIGDVAMQINPLVGGIVKVGGFLGDAMGSIVGGTDGMTGADAALGSTFGNVLGVGLINSAFGKKADTIVKDTETWEDQGSAYGGSLAKVDDALTKSGKKYGLVSGGARRRANREIAEANRQQNKIAGINEEAQQSFAASNYAGIGTRNQLALSGGMRRMSVGKLGMKLYNNELEFAKRALAAKPVKEEVEEVESFKEGGKVNVIPDGALHAHKHHLEDVNPELEGVTSKGIPVITKEDGGEIKQHAEIERNEIIFNLDVTNKLEELMKKGTDEAAIEAGKLLVHEILNNTIDNTGLMEEVE